MATRQASTSSSSTTSFVLKSVSSIFTGRTPGSPAPKRGRFQSVFFPNAQHDAGLADQGVRRRLLRSQGDRLSLMPARQQPCRSQLVSSIPAGLMHAAMVPLLCSKHDASARKPPSPACQASYTSRPASQPEEGFQPSDLESAGSHSPTGTPAATAFPDRDLCTQAEPQNVHLIPGVTLMASTPATAPSGTQHALTASDHQQACQPCLQVHLDPCT